VYHVHHHHPKVVSVILNQLGIPYGMVVVPYTHPMKSVPVTIQVCGLLSVLRLMASDYPFVSSNFFSGEENWKESLTFLRLLKEPHALQYVTGRYIHHMQVLLEYCYTLIILYCKLHPSGSSKNKNNLTYIHYKHRTSYIELFQQVKR
jgi:hypothetical protein